MAEVFAPESPDYVNLYEKVYWLIYKLNIPKNIQMVNQKISKQRNKLKEKKTFPISFSTWLQTTAP